MEKRYWVRLTKICNNNCIFCLDKEVQDGSFISLNILEEDLKKGIKEKATRAILSGGEPSIHPNFFEIITLAKKIGYKKVQVITNGRMFAYKEFLNKVIKCGVDEITFSMPAHKKEIYEIQTGIKRSFAQSIKGLVNALKTKKIIVNVDVVINKLNYKFLPEIIKFYNSLGIYEFDLLQVVPFGSAWKNKNKIFYELKDITTYIGEVIKFADERGIKIWTNRLPAAYLEGYEYLIQGPIKIYDEVKGREEIFNAYIKDNIIMPCYGDRCEFCFMYKFCQELISLKEKTKIMKAKDIKNKQNINKIPLCINKKDTLLKEEKYKTDVFDNNYKIDIHKFAKYFIKYKYKVKSLRCKSCEFFNSCEGVHIDYVRNFGFKILGFKLSDKLVENLPQTDSFQLPILDKLLKCLSENLPLNKIIYDKWKLEEIYPYGQTLIALQFKKINENKIFLFCIGPPDKNIKSMLHTTYFNLYGNTIHQDKYFQVINNSIINLSKYVEKLLLKTPELKLLLELYKKTLKTYDLPENNNLDKDYITIPDRKKVSEKQKLYRIWVGYPCDFNCIFCSLNDVATMNNIGKQQVALFKKEMDKGREKGITSLQITGYEILNYPYIFEVIKYAKDIGYQELQVYTTGIKLADKILAKEFVNNLGDKFLIHLPLYGPNSKIHNSITKLKGSFNQLITGIDNLLVNCKPENIMVSTVVIKQNYKYISQMVNLVKSLGLNILNCRVPYPVTESKYDRYNLVAVKFSAMLPFLFAYDPPILLDVMYPCIFFNYLWKNKKVLSCYSSETLSYIPFLNDADNNLLRGVGEEKNLHLYSRVCLLNCPYIKDCILAPYCVKKVFRKYLEIFGDKEFCCITEKVLNELKENIASFNKTFF